MKASRGILQLCAFASTLEKGRLLARTRPPIHLRAHASTESPAPTCSACTVEYAMSVHYLADIKVLRALATRTRVGSRLQVAPYLVLLGLGK